jgi:hypothetical protein
VVLLLEGYFVSWSLAMNEHDGHTDLRSSGRAECNILRPRENSVVLIKPGLARVSLGLSYDRESVFSPCEEVSTLSFYSLRPGSYNETRGPTSDPEVVENLYSI